MGRFVQMGSDGNETALIMRGLPNVTEVGSVLRSTVPLSSGGTLQVIFDEREIRFALSGAAARARLALQFEWVAERSAFRELSGDMLRYRFRDFDYAVRIAGGIAAKTGEGAKVVSGAAPSLRLILAQGS